MRWLNIIILCVVILFGGLYYISPKNNNSTQSAAKTSVASDDLLTKAADIDKALNAIQVQAKHLPPRPWTLPDIFTALPAGVTITQIKQDESTKQITIVGHAANSEIVVAYKKKLMTLRWVKDVNLPLDNFTVPKNEFTLTVIP